MCLVSTSPLAPSVYSYGERYFNSCVTIPCAHVYPASKLAEVRRKLAEADEVDIRQGSALHQVAGSVFIRNGLEIEEQQWVSHQPSCINRILTVPFTIGDSLHIPSKNYQNPTCRLLQFKKSATL